MKKRGTILGATIGNCIHVSGILHFLEIAEQEGYEVVFLGTAVSIEQLFTEINKIKPDIVALSYRLTPENFTFLIEEIVKRNRELSFQVKWEFGGTKPVADIAARYNFFSFISDGYDDINDSIAFLRGFGRKEEKVRYPDNFVGRVKASYPYPLLRHHFGLPSMKDTIEGIEKISESKVLDVISLGPDQNAQQYFFKQHKMNPNFDGAGGVPIRNIQDLKNLKAASLTGNYPLMRCYSGTEDIFQYAELLINTIQNAWAAIPLCWYNELDGRGTRTLENSIAEAQNLIRWHAERNIPVEINEPHHWGLRDAHDTISVAMAYISAYNAKALGVRHYIAQYMFNTPNGLSFSMDIAKVLAMMELVSTLEDSNFTVYRETRAGLPLFSANPYIAKGQLAASTFMQMLVKPHIIHVVSFCEANHAATAKDVIESSYIVKGVIKHTLQEQFAFEQDESILKRKRELVSEAKYLIEFIKDYFCKRDIPLLNSAVISESIKKGILDAVHIKKNEKFKGNLHTRIVDGKCLAYDKNLNICLTEAQRINSLLKKKGEER